MRGSKSIAPGIKFGRVVTTGNSMVKNGSSYYEVKCECGNVKYIWAADLKRRCNIGCGCQSRARKPWPPISETKLYQTWANMRQRCNNPKIPKYKNCGGRVISVCDEWFDFRAFYEWAISSGYQEGLSLDRINNDGHYEPSNCRWATASQQRRNTRNSTTITIDGITKTAPDWAESRIGNASAHLIRDRIKRGWHPKDAVTMPPDQHRIHLRKQHDN